jgi:hypothetical protein
MSLSDPSQMKFCRASTITVGPVPRKPHDLDVRLPALARLDAGDLVDLAAGPRLHQLVHRAAEGARIAQHVVMSRNMIPGLG